MGLIAREIEERGIPTLCLTSALSITQAVAPPRAVFVDFPLGHTAGKPHDGPVQDRIIEGVLHGFETLEPPGGIVRLPLHWSEDDGWKDGIMRPRGDGDGAHRDDRQARSAEPQYQTDADRRLAEGPNP